VGLKQFEIDHRTTLADLRQLIASEASVLAAPEESHPANCALQTAQAQTPTRQRIPFAVFRASDGTLVDAADEYATLAHLFLPQITFQEAVDEEHKRHGSANRGATAVDGSPLGAHGDAHASRPDAVRRGSRRGGLLSALRLDEPVRLTRQVPWRLFRGEKAQSNDWLGALDVEGLTHMHEAGGLHVGEEEELLPGQLDDKSSTRTDKHVGKQRAVTVTANASEIAREGRRDVALAGTRVPVGAMVFRGRSKTSML
jgi:hypothetical protein